MIMSNIQAIIDKKKSQSTQPKQSKSSSLLMNGFKSMTPVIIDIINKGGSKDEISAHIASNVQNILEKQARLIEDLISLSGGITDSEQFIWRRSLTIACQDAANKSPINHQIVCAILSNQDNAKRMCDKLGINHEELRELISTVNKYHIYQENQTYFSTLESTIFKVSSNINNLINTINWHTEKNTARDIITQGTCLIALSLYKSQFSLVSDKQRLMLQKSCVNHAGKIITSITKKIAKFYKNDVLPERIDEFEEALSADAEFAANSIKYCAHLVTDTLFEMESSHLTSNLTLSESGMTISELLNNYETLQSMSKSSNDGSVLEANNIIAKRIVNTLNDCKDMVNHTLANIDQYLINIDDDKSKEYVKHCLFSSLTPIIKNLNDNDISIDIRHLKMASNLSIYLLSEAPAKNDALNEAGVFASKITEFRAARDLAYAIGLSSPFQYRQLIVPTVAELSKCLLETQRFSWGLSLGYLAPMVGTQLLKSTNELFIANRNSVISSSTSLYQASLEIASNTFVSLWRSESQNTLDNSQRNYGRGKISAADSKSILDKFFSLYQDQISEHQYTSEILRSQIKALIPESGEIAKPSSGHEPNVS